MLESVLSVCDGEVMLDPASHARVSLNSVDSTRMTCGPPSRLYTHTHSHTHTHPSSLPLPRTGNLIYPSRRRAIHMRCNMITFCRVLACKQAGSKCRA